MRVKLAELKIKVCYLAEEQRLIRHEENKCRRRARIAAIQVDVSGGPRVMSHKRKRRIHPFPHSRSGPIEQLAAGLRAFWPKDPVVPVETLEERRQVASNAFEELNSWRRIDQRPKVRAALLAYGFLRGRAYATMEAANTYEAPDWGDVWQNVVRFGGDGASIRQQITFAEWCGAAVAHLVTGHDKTRHAPGRVLVWGKRPTNPIDTNSAGLQPSK